MSFLKNIFTGSGAEKSEKTSQSGLNWKVLQTEEELDVITKASDKKTVIIFKHSISCPISAMAKGRLERNWGIASDKADIYYLDLITFRNVSNKIEEKFQVVHASPQVLVIKNGVSVYDNSHYGIDPSEIAKVIG